MQNFQYWFMLSSTSSNCLYQSTIRFQLAAGSILAPNPSSPKSIQLSINPRIICNPLLTTLHLLKVSATLTSCLVLGQRPELGCSLQSSSSIPRSRLFYFSEIYEQQTNPNPYRSLVAESIDSIENIVWVLNEHFSQLFKHM